MDFNVKLNGYYDYWKEEDLLDRIEEKIMLILRKEPQPTCKITLLTDQEEKRNSTCCCCFCSCC